MKIIMRNSGPIYKSYHIKITLESYDSHIQSLFDHQCLDNGDPISIVGSVRDFVISRTHRQENSSDKPPNARVMSSNAQKGVRVKVVFMQDQNTVGYRNTALLLGFFTLMGGITSLISGISRDGIDTVRNLSFGGYLGWFTIAFFSFLASVLRQRSQLYPSPLSEALNECIIFPFDATEVDWSPSLIERLGFLR